MMYCFTNSEGKEEGGEEMATFDDSDGVSAFKPFNVHVVQAIVYWCLYCVFIAWICRKIQYSYMF